MVGGPDDFKFCSGVGVSFFFMVLVGSKVATTTQSGQKTAKSSCAGSYAGGYLLDTLPSCVK